MVGAGALENASSTNPASRGENTASPAATRSIASARSGGVIVFDDYGWKMFHKQKEAEDDFMRRRGYEILEMPTGQGLVVKR